MNQASPGGRDGAPAVKPRIPLMHVS